MSSKHDSVLCEKQKINKRRSIVTEENIEENSENDLESNLIDSSQQ